MGWRANSSHEAFIFLFFFIRVVRCLMAGREFVMNGSLLCQFMNKSCPNHIFCVRILLSEDRVLPHPLH